MSVPSRENGKACRVCSLQFGLFSRRHHCRSCGNSVCDTHSQTRRQIGDQPDARVCDSCVQARVTPGEGSPAEGEAESDGLIYATRAVCPRCMLESRDVSWRAASVVEEDRHVWLLIHCEQHEQFKLHYSSDPALFRKGLEITALPPWAVLWDSCVGAQGCAPEARSIASAQASMLPAVVELSLFVGGKFLEDAEISLQLCTAVELYSSQDQQFVFKANGKLASDIPGLNQKLRVAIGVLPRSCAMVVELTHERMTELCLLEDSALLESHVFPCIRSALRVVCEQSVVLSLIHI
eukprot:TRINITY_DN18980_c0_g1_i1.p1 TRINITY_DN18980_c0_g1~~TRINITY_DN18980_c0_g1_i1.p1  ORF type:complete len:294 (+),score=61.94 TRINITY_DN18980_c0_g1_i1:42-923(+)